MEQNQIDLDKKVLSYCFFTEDCLKHVMKHVRFDDFDQPHYQRLFKIVNDTWVKHGDCNFAIILGDYGVEINNAFLKAVDFNPYFHELEGTVKYFIEKSRLRKIIKVCEQSITAIKETNIGETGVINYIKTSLHQLELQNEEPHGITVSRGMEYLKEEIEKNKTAPKQNKMWTGFKEIDEILGGLLPMQMIVIAARPSVGKTTLALNIFSKLFMSGYDGVFLSLEMSSEELCKKIASDLFNEDFSAVKNLKVSNNFEATLQNFIQQPISSMIFDKGCSKIESIELELKRRKDLGCLDFAVIDYLQRIGTRNGSGDKYNDVTAVSMRLKELAIELNIPIIVLAQLSRKVEERADPTPFLSDLRDSGSIEADADIVMLLSRRELKDPYDRPGVMEVNIAKNRAGRTKKIMLKAELEKSRLVDYTI